MGDCDAFSQSWAGKCCAYRICTSPSVDNSLCRITPLEKIADTLEELGSALCLFQLINEDVDVEADAADEALNLSFFDESLATSEVVVEGRWGSAGIECQFVGANSLFTLLVNDLDGELEDLLA